MVPMAIPRRADCGVDAWIGSLDVESFDASKWVENTLEFFSGRNPSQFSEENARNSLNEIVFRDPLPSPYVALGVGAGVDDEGHFMVLALAHGRPEFAIQNREMLVSRILHSGDPFIQFSNVNTSNPARQVAPTLWAGTLGASSIETDVNGSSLTVRVRGDSGGLAGHFISSGFPSCCTNRGKER